MIEPQASAKPWKQKNEVKIRQQFNVSLEIFE